MPYSEFTDYYPPLWLRNAHAQTIWPSLFRRVKQPWFKPFRLETRDGDFIDLDFIPAQPGKRSERGLALLSHGLEGSSKRHYMLGMAWAMLSLGLDVYSRNFRHCSGIPNRKPYMYHSGETSDLHRSVEHAVEQGYARIVLIGFSMGGNQVLKYLGQGAPGQQPCGAQAISGLKASPVYPSASPAVPKEIVAAACFSVPCNLYDSSMRLATPANRIYMEYFMYSLRRKIREKAALFPGSLDVAGLDRIKDFKTFDDRYTAPLHGFASAEDYWTKAGCLPFLEAIQTPCLLVNAANDPFLTPSCSPVEIARRHADLFLKIPGAGGHVGFVPSSGARYWSENSAVKFLRPYIL